MSALIISLPLAGASPNAAYPFTENSEGSALGQATLASLPSSPRPTEVVAVIPAAALSWHRVSLPAGKALRGSALQAVLVGLLEERLLGDVQDLHLALQPNWQTGQAVWVAVCNKAWLQAHLQALESVQLPIRRLVPQLWPTAEGSAAQWLAMGSPQDGWFWTSSAQGVWGLPLPWAAESVKPSSAESAQSAGAELWAEPAMAAWAEQAFQQSPRLQPPADQLRKAVQSDWDLAQFELAASGRARWLKVLEAARQTLGQSPAWRAARWGVLALVVTELVGLNAWAFKLQSDLRLRQSGMTQVLTQTFPHIQLVLDAPLQMRQEVQRLRQSTGQSARDGLEPMLAALGPVLPPGYSVSQLDFQEGMLRLRLTSSEGALHNASPQMAPASTPALSGAAQNQAALSPAQAASMQSQLEAQHYRIRLEGSDWVMTAFTPGAMP